MAINRNFDMATCVKYALNVNGGTSVYKTVVGSAEILYVKKAMDHVYMDAWRILQILIALNVNLVSTETTATQHVQIVLMVLVCLTVPVRLVLTAFRANTATAFVLLYALKQHQQSKHATCLAIAWLAVRMDFTMLNAMTLAEMLAYREILNKK